MDKKLIEVEQTPIQTLKSHPKGQYHTQIDVLRFSQTVTYYAKNIFIKIQAAVHSSVILNWIACSFELLGQSQPQANKS